MGDWTIEQAREAWRVSEDVEYDSDWDVTIMNLLIGKVELEVAVKILNIIWANRKDAAAHRLTTSLPDRAANES